MQEHNFADGRRIKEVFEGNTQEEIFDKMRVRAKEIEATGEVVSVSQKMMGKNSKCWCGSKRAYRCCHGKLS